MAKSERKKKIRNRQISKLSKYYAEGYCGGGGSLTIILMLGGYPGEHKIIASFIYCKITTEILNRHQVLSNTVKCSHF